MEDTPSTTLSSTPIRAKKSELEKFKLFYEFDVDAKEIRTQLKQQTIAPLHTDK